ncbi:hypothetical protein CKM354_000329300 [Cercospora kikuchii]|uniref:OPT oligopeptide transporter protein-domain-containing protein n=1 Tax=Cercospora kikuchii TaxID=84275 RepID=A0A9P3FA54_9PEZI|nr:uncharacterized protein CKM354_000329300 [Cercospora kikuchii]GIZ39931.1 hypothetical protein CKM354_000329300 [Cercospora kikuchii]
MESVEKSAEKVPCEDVSQVHLQACLDERNDVGETIHVPSDDEGVIDPRLKDYPVTMVARTVHLHNDPTEPILTFRFWFLSTFWVTVGCALSTLYYFKPYQQSISSYVIQLLAWAMGDAMARYLPKREMSWFRGRFKWSMNPGPWNAKEHALVVVAYWGSSHTAYGLGPLTAMEMYYGQKISAVWGILFLVTSQLLGYGFAGLFRDILVRPPKMFYPSVLPNIALFNAMHRNPSVTRRSLAFFTYCATAAFIWQWLPQYLFPLLISLPLLCWLGHGNPIAYVLGSGKYGFGILDFSLDWNYINGTMQSMYTPFWASTNQFTGIFVAVWTIYPILYYTNSLDAQNYAAMSASTFDREGKDYNISRVLTPQYILNQTAMDEYSPPYWSVSYVFCIFWGIAASMSACAFVLLWYGKDTWAIVRKVFRKEVKSDGHYDDPYLKLMAGSPRVPHWWYLTLLGLCASFSIATVEAGGFNLPWWGFIVMSMLAFAFMFPCGVIFAISGQIIGMNFLSEIIAGSLFKGNPIAVLTAMTYGTQSLVQSLNLVIDFKFGFYMRIPETEMFIGQFWGTLLGPFINYAVMRAILQSVGIPTLTGKTPSVNWDAARTRNFYSSSVIWGVLGPEQFFSKDSMYSWVYYAFLTGPAAVLIVWLFQQRLPKWDMEKLCNPPLIFYGISLFPIYPTTSILTSFIAAVVFMGYIYRYHPAFWRKYHYLLAVGLDCGTQVMSTVMAFAISIPNVKFPTWWGNNPTFPDRCFPPNQKLPSAMQIMTQSER